MRELPGIDAIPAIIKPSEIAFSFNLLVISFKSSMVYIISSKSYFFGKKLINNLNLLKENISELSKNS